MLSFRLKYQALCSPRSAFSLFILAFVQCLCAIKEIYRQLSHNSQGCTDEVCGGALEVSEFHPGPSAALADWRDLHWPCPYSPYSVSRWPRPAEIKVVLIHEPRKVHFTKTPSNKDPLYEPCVSDIET